MVTVGTNISPQLGLKVDALTHIDIAEFTQSELHSLSLCSSVVFDIHNNDDLVIPTIHPSFFNRSSITHRPKPPKQSPTGATHRAENKCILNFLKHLLGENNEECMENNSMQIVVYDKGNTKRKRGSENHDGEIDKRVEFEIMNVNGVAVDFGVLKRADDLYGAELRKRTAGMETEEDGLGFFRGLEGIWGSTRKKRRIIDASLIGDWLPIGWKLLLALRRKSGRFSVYCRTYISPSGLQFPSCKDAAHYLLSHSGFSDSNLPIDQGNNGVQHTNNMESGSKLAGSTHKPDEVNDNSNSPVPNSLLSETYVREVSLLDIDNLPEVQVSDTFECRKCSMIFGEKGSYMKHLLSYHKKTTRRFKLGSSVAKGVIIKDGKFECQFCHKVFLEKRRYNCHVGIHVRTNVRKSKKLQGQGTAVPSRKSKLDALLQVAETSVVETSSLEPNGGSIEGRTSIEELGVDEVGLMEGHIFQSLPEISKDFACNGSLKVGPNSFVSLESEAVMASKHQLTSICVWCRSEFYHEATDLEHLSDSIGFMCPMCKSKTSAD